MTSQPQELSLKITRSLTEGGGEVRQFVADRLTGLVEQRGMTLSDDPNTAAAQLAQLKDELTSDIDNQVEIATKAFRWLLWDMRATGDWKLAQKPILSPVTGKQLKDTDGVWQFRAFASYEEWLEDKIAGKSDTVKSGLRNGVKYLMEAVDQGRVSKPDNTPYEVNDVMKMSEQNFGIMAGKARMMADEGKVEDISQFMPTALGKSRAALLEMLDKAHITRRNVPKVEAHRVFLANGEMIVAFRMTDKQFRSFDSRNRRDVDWASDSEDQLIKFVKETVHETDDQPAAIKPPKRSNRPHVQDNPGPQHAGERPMSAVLFADAVED